MTNFEEIIAFENTREIVENVTNYGDVKDKIKVRLYNQAKAKDIKGIYKSASEYGFDDLIIVPIIDFGMTLEGNASMKIPASLIEIWGVTEDEVYTKGIENLDYTIQSMTEIMIDMMRRDGAPEEIIEMMMMPSMDVMWVVSNENKLAGASGIIKAKAELEERFPDGYVVLPSSIHEVIVMAKTEDMDKEYMLDMVTEINGGCVAEEDKLADNVYEF